MPLSMLSALARRNVDPWEEAARLARLPHEAAKRFLTALITTLPATPSARSDPAALAEQLIALLPQQRAASAHSFSGIPAIALATQRHGLTRYLAFYLVLMMFYLVAQWFLGSAHRAPQTGAPAAPAAAIAAPGTR